MSIKSYLYSRRPEMAIASEYYGNYRAFRKAGFQQTSQGFWLAGLPSMQNGTYQSEETARIIACLKEADVFIDVGANMGYYACIARSMGLRVLAVEPLWGNLQFLYGNMERNGWNDVEIFPVGLSEKPGMAILYGVGTAASLIKDWSGISTKKRVTPLSTLDILTGDRFRNLKLVVKIDVEGVEYSVLQGAKNLLLSSPAPVWIVESVITDYFPGGVNENFRKVFDLFWSKGYAAFSMLSDRDEPIDENRLQRWNDQRDTSGNFNFLFRKDSPQK